LNDLDKKAKIGTMIAAIVLGIGFSVYFLQEDVQLETYDGPPRAVIIDQLYDEMPNENFHLKATEYLEKAGYTVDIITTKDITVDYYKNLPSMNYKYVVVRTHGAENTNDVVLFTGERYSEEKYIQEQLLGQVQKAAPLRDIAYKIDGSESADWKIINKTTKVLTTSVKPTDQTKDEYFAIGSNLVNNGMNGKFDDTIFLLGGCNTLSNPSLAKSLTDKGASMVVGWDNTVGNWDNDYGLLFFLENSLVKNEQVDQILNKLEESKPPERMAYPSVLTYFR